MTFAQEVRQTFTELRHEFRDISDRELLLQNLAASLVLHAALTRIEAQNKSILEGLMETQKDLDAGIATLTADTAAVLAAVQTAGAATSTGFSDLLAKIAANPNAPVSDFASEVAVLSQSHISLQAAITSLTAINALATQDDPGTADAAAAPADAPTT